MARRIVITLVDDYDGTSTADETVMFGIDGVSYEIDLSAANAEMLRKELGQWTSHARRVGRQRTEKGSRAKAATSASARRDELAAIRTWAAANGYQVANRGRIGAEVVEAYRNANV